MTMLDLTGKDVFRKVVFDSATGHEVELTHRLPTTSEEVEFQRKTFRRRERKSISPEDIAKNLAEIRIDFGLRIVTGFKEGDFGVDGKPISSDPNSPLYWTEWKALLREKAPRILSALAVAVFEGGRVVAADEDDEEGDEDPFPGS
jgi:hypothetical protein